MATTAQNAASLFGKLRTSFNSLDAGSFPVAPVSPQPIQVLPTTLVQPQAVSAQPLVTSSAPVVAQPPADPVSTADKLAVLDEVLSGIEQQAAAAVAAAPMTDPVSAQPVVQPVQPVVTPTVAPVEVPTQQPVAQTQPEVTPQPVVVPQPAVAPQPVAAPQPDLGLVAQAAPTAVDQTVALQQAQQPISAAPTKETFVGTTTMVEAAAATPVVEAATGVQYVEQEPAPEIPPEVSEYLAHVENHANQQPQEIVIAEPQQQVPLATNYPKQSVIVLPITPAVEQKGKTKGPLESIRWLVEWSYKMMKVFSGRIIYREVEQS